MRRIVTLLVVGIVLLGAALFGADAAASRLLSSEDIRTRVQAALTPLGVDLTFDDARLHILPRPRVTLTGVGVSGAIPASGTIGSVSVFPRLRSLLNGRLEAGLLALNAPDLRIELPQGAAGEAPAAAPADIRAAVGATLGGLSQRLQAAAPGLALRVDDGTLRFLSGERTALLLASVDGRVAVANDDLQLQLGCSSDLWEDLTIDTTLRLPALTGSGTIKVEQLRGLPLMQAVLPESASALGLTILSAQGTFALPDPQTVNLTVTGSIPTMAIKRADTQLPVRVTHFGATVNLRPETAEVRLDGIDVEAPRLHVSGTMNVDRRTPQIRLTLRAADADLTAIRAAVTAMTPDVVTVQQVADIVRGGALESLQFTAFGATAADLGKPSNFVIHGNVANARLVVPPSNVPLTDVGGDFAIEGGMLRADRASGRAGKTTARDGHLRIPLIGGIPDFALSCRIDADAAEVPDLLQSFVLNEDFRARVRDVTNVTGSLAAELTVRQTWLGWSSRVDTKALDLSATDRRLGLPVQLRAGSFSYDSKRVAFVGLRGRVGQTALSDVSGRWSLEELGDVAVVSGPANLQLADVYRAIRHYAPHWAALADIRAASGPVALDFLTVHVPAGAPENWGFATSGTTTAAQLDTSGPLDSVTVAARFWGTRAVVGLSDMSVAFADARLTGAGCITDRGGRTPRFDLALAGTFGPTATSTLATTAGLPDNAGTRREVTTPNLLLVWQPGAFASIASPLNIANGPFVDLDLQWSPSRIDLRHLTVRDAQSNATIGMQMAANQLDVQFRGRLDHQTVDTLIARNQYVWGVIEGDFGARVVVGQPDASRARGVLQAQSVVVPLGAGQPALIEAITLRTEPTQVVIDSATVTWGDSRFSVAGRADLSGGNIALDLDATTNSLSLDALASAFESGASHRSGAFRGLPHIPVRGVIRLVAESVTARQLTWDAVTARIRLTDTSAEALVTSATLCHVSTPGTVKVTDGGLAVALMPRAQDQPLSATLACVEASKALSTGTYNLQADLTGSGPPAELARNLSGPFDLDIKNGHISRMGWLGRVMEVLSVTDVFEGKLPDMNHEGLDYSDLSLTGTIRGGTMDISECVLKASPLTLVTSGNVNFATGELNLTVLASPVGSMNSVLGRIPVLGNIFGNSLVSIPLTVTGNMDAPTVTPLSPTAVGDHVFGILKRTVETPVRLIQPLLPSGR